jgi:hypothetical protein
VGADPLERHEDRLAASVVSRVRPDHLR